MAAKLTPLSSLRVSRYRIPEYGLLPNSSVQNRPLLIYHSVFDSSHSAQDIEKHINSIGAVQPQWRYTMYTTTHFHSTTHELLCVSNGKAKLCFGGEENPDRVEYTAQQGDVLLLPAGLGHRLLEDIDGGFEMVGCYPPGKQWDMCYGKAGEESKVKDSKSLAWFKKDPIFGDQGPALEVD